MIDSVLNLLFRCPHHRLSRPVAPVTKVGQPSSRSYVVCLDCGKQFEYDVTRMRIGKPIEHPPDGSGVPPAPPKTKKKTIKRVLQAVLASAVVFGAVWKGKKKS